MEQIHTPKKPVGQPICGIPDDVVHALLADAGLLQRKYPRRTSKPFSPRSSDCGLSTKRSSKPQPQPKSELEARIESQFDDCATNADQRLREFMRKERCLVEKDGTEHWYDPDENRTYTLEEVGTIMGVTRERVRQIEETALRKMWRLIRSMNMREDLDESDWLKGMGENGNKDRTIYLPDPV